MNKISKQQQQKTTGDLISQMSSPLALKEQALRNRALLWDDVSVCFAHTEESEITDELFRDAGGANCCCCV